MKYVMIYAGDGDTRCTHLVRFITNDKESYTVILAAGRDPSKETLEPVSHQMRKRIQEELLANNFEARPQSDGSVLFKKGYQWVTIVCLDGNNWGTFEQTIACIEYLKSQKIREVHLISEQNHFPRINRIWRLTAWTIKTKRMGSIWIYGDPFKESERKKMVPAAISACIYLMFGRKAVTWLMGIKL